VELIYEMIIVLMSSNKILPCFKQNSNAELLLFFGVVLMQIVLQDMEQLWYVLLTGFPLVFRCFGFFQFLKAMKTKSLNVL